MKTLVFERSGEGVLAEYKADLISNEGNLTGMWSQKNLTLVIAGKPEVTLGENFASDDLTDVTVSITLDGVEIATYEVSGTEDHSVITQGIVDAIDALDGYTSTMVVVDHSPAEDGYSVKVVFDDHSKGGSTLSIDGSDVDFNKSGVIVGGELVNSEKLIAELELMENNVQNFIKFCTKYNIKLTSFDQGSSTVLYDPAG